MLNCNGTDLNFSEGKMGELEKQVLKLKEDFVSIYGEAPWTIKYKKDIIQKDPDNRGRTLKPKNIAIPLQSSLKDKVKGMQQWVYYESLHYDHITEKDVPFPHRLNLDGKLIIQEGDWELAVFLRYFSPYCENNYNKGKKTYFYFENLVHESKNEIIKRNQRVQVDWLLVHENSTLQKDDCMKLCYLYNISIDKKDDYNTIKIKLLNKVEEEERKTGTGYKRFLETYKFDEMTEMRAKSNKLIADGHLSIDHTQKKIRFKMADGKKGDIICNLRSGLTPEESLFDFLKNHTDKQDDLFCMLK